MAIQIPQRVFLDTCALLDLAHGKYPDAMKELRRMVDRDEANIVITYDHVEEFCHSPNRAQTEAEARQVDSLRPLWQTPGAGIYHREAYSEYLRLTRRRPLPPVCPAGGYLRALLQSYVDCDWDPQVISNLEALLAWNERTGVRQSFSDEVVYCYELERVQPSHAVLKTLKEAFGDGRMWAKDTGWTKKEWDNFLHDKWIEHLCKPPGRVPEQEVQSIYKGVVLKNMPAWYARIRFEQTWCANKASKPKQGDLYDMAQLAQLPYVHVFVTDAHMASLICQARLCLAARVYPSVEKWLEDV